MLCLMERPYSYKRLREEIDTAVVAKQIQPDLNIIVSDQRARKLPYLQAVIKEVSVFDPLL